MKYNQYCEVCKKQLKKTFIFIDCSYFEYHPKNECGGCEYPVGLCCAKKIPKEFHSDKWDVMKYQEALEKWHQEEEKK